MDLLNFIKNPSSRTLLALTGAASAAALLVALVGQYGFHLHPCELCIAQRYPYAAIILLATTGVLWVRAPKILWRVVLLAGFLFAIDAGIAAYHAGVELHVFPGPAACTNTSQAPQTLEEMRREIMNAPLVACDQPMLEVLGLSMAAWNAIAATLLAAGTFFTLWKIHERAR